MVKSKTNIENFENEFPQNDNAKDTEPSIPMNTTSNVSKVC